MLLDKAGLRELSRPNRLLSVKAQLYIAAELEQRQICSAMAQRKGLPKKEQLTKKINK